MKVAVDVSSINCFVLDCSVAAAWVLVDEITPQTEELLDYLKGNSALVPHLWYSEIGNVLLKSERRGRADAAQIVAGMKRLEKLPIKGEAEAGIHVLQDVLRLARVHNLTAYDATYLELALRRRIALATLDGELAQAAKAEGVKVLPA